MPIDLDRLDDDAYLLAFMVEHDPTAAPPTVADLPDVRAVYRAQEGLPARTADEAHRMALWFALLDEARSRSLAC